MSIVNNSNFNMPSLNELIDINANSVSSTNISSDLISSKNVDTQTLYVNGIDLGTQVNLSAQKLTAITYTGTPTPKTNVSSNLVVSEQLNVSGTTNFSSLTNWINQLIAYEDSTFEKNLMVNLGIYTCIWSN